jgi:hypothetical protein
MGANERGPEGREAHEAGPAADRSRMLHREEGRWRLRRAPNPMLSSRMILRSSRQNRRVGRRIVYRARDVESYLDAHAVDPEVDR